MAFEVGNCNPHTNEEGGRKRRFIKKNTRQDYHTVIRDMVAKKSHELGEPSSFATMGEGLRAVLPERMILYLKLLMFKRYREAKKDFKKISLRTQRIRTS